MSRHQAIRVTPRVNAKVTEELKRRKAAAEAHRDVVTKFVAAGIDIAPFDLVGDDDGTFCQSCCKAPDQTDSANACAICNRPICISCSRLFSPPDVVRARMREHAAELRSESGAQPAEDDASPEKKRRVSDGEDEDGSDGSDSEDSVDAIDDENLRGICRSCTLKDADPLVTPQECAGAIYQMARAHTFKTKGEDAEVDVRGFLDYLQKKDGIDGEEETKGLMAPDPEKVPAPPQPDY